MIVICAWCDKDLGDKEPLGNNDISHGICKECAKVLKAEMEKSKKEWKGIPRKQITKKGIE